MTVPVIPEHPLNFGIYRPLFWLRDVDANSLLDQEMRRLGSFQRYKLLTGWCFTPQIDMTGAIMSIWTRAGGGGGGGIQMVTSANLTVLTVAAGQQQLTVFTPPIVETAPQEPTAFIRFSTARGAAGTIRDVMLYGIALD